MGKRKRLKNRAAKKARRAQRKRTRAARNAAKGKTRRAKKLIAKAEKLEKKSTTLTGKASVAQGIMVKRTWLDRSQQGCKLEISWQFLGPSTLPKYKKHIITIAPSSIFRDDRIQGLIEVLDGDVFSCTVTAPNRRYTITVIGSNLENPDTSEGTIIDGINYIKIDRCASARLKK